MLELTKENVLKSLRQVTDPDLHRDIVSLGFVKGLEIKGKDIRFNLELTTPACPVRDQFKADCEKVIRKDIKEPISEGAREFLHIEKNIPVILILGGSLGSETINSVIMESLPAMVEKYAIIHQTGKSNIEENIKTGETVLFQSKNKDRYKPFDYLNALALRMSAGIASVVISRAGSTIFEIAAWGIPSIIIPIGEAVSHDQKSNAFAYARTGAGEVIEEDNLTTHILLAEIDRLINNIIVREKMIIAAKNFYKDTAAHEIAEEILKIALSHEVEK